MSTCRTHTSHPYACTHAAPRSRIPAGDNSSSDKYTVTRCARLEGLHSRPRMRLCFRCGRCWWQPAQRSRPCTPAYGLLCKPNPFFQHSRAWLRRASRCGHCCRTAQQRWGPRIICGCHTDTHGACRWQDIVSYYQLKRWQRACTGHSVCSHQCCSGIAGGRTPTASR
jgi:hypothetical protein